MKRILSKSICLMLCGATLLCSCAQKESGSSAAEQSSSSSALESTSSLEEYVVSAPADKVYTFADNSPVFSLDDTFYPCSIKVDLLTETSAQIYYTLDNSEPTKESNLFTESLFFECEKTDFPTAHTVKAKAFYEDGTESAVSVHTYFCAKNIDERFTTPVFSISGDPSVLTEGPDGILYGDNYKLRGSESEREVHLQAWDRQGNEILSQYCGIRIYGGASRESSIKSFKLFARKRYSSGMGSFKTDIFQTPVADSSGEIISKYDKLVLRNSGNDFQFAFIRDELNQTLAMQAGFTDYEAVVPTVCYLNGEYYGMLWLHENYCDEFFKNKYPNENALGEFVILEGNESEKNVEEGDDTEPYAIEFNAMYNEFANCDLTDESNYAQLCEFMDVENYLDYYAFNIYINNKDWPQNNYKCYRYIPLEGEAQSDGVYDGKWRFLLHDMDYTYGMYEQVEVMANYNNIGQILKPGSERYSPLFEKLMHRSDCRDYFEAKITELANGVLSEENILETFNSLKSSKYFEQLHYYDHIENKRNKGAHDLWTYKGHLADFEKLITDFIAVRSDYILSYVDQELAKFEASDTATDETSEAA